MANSTTHLDTISSSQSQKEVTANDLFDAMSANALFGRHASASAGLTWGYYGGKFQKSDGTLVSVDNDSISLTASATNYLYVDADGVVQKVTAAPAGWPAPLAADAIALYEIVCGASAVTSYTDHRAPMRGPAGPEGPEGPEGPSGSSYFDVHAFYPSVMADNSLLLRVPLARACEFAANFAGSFGKASAASTGTATLDVKKNGVSCGSIVFTTDDEATFTTSGGSAVSFAAGDVLSIHGPATADATLADVGIALAGTRV
jgi:hypothetical protein